jgi:hypothetical protein
MTTPHNQPVRKVASSAIAGAVVVIIVWALNTYLLAEPMPAEIVAALTTLVSFGVGYLVPPSKRDMGVDETDP